MNAEACTKVCNALLRGEISAMETYDQALEKFSTETESSVLREIKEDHARAAKALRENIIEMGGSPSDDSGAWGEFAKGVQGSAKLFGEQAAIAALEAGEKYGLKQYEDALKDDDVLPDCKSMIREQLIPRQRQHIAVLERLEN